MSQFCLKDAKNLCKPFYFLFVTISRFMGLAIEILRRGKPWDRFGKVYTGVAVV